MLVNKAEVERRKNAILEYIVSHPGCNVTEIAGDLGLHRTNVRKMIRGFEKKGVLTVGTVKTRDDQSEELEDRREKIINILRTTPGMTIKTLSDKFEVTKTVINNDLEIIEKRMKHDQNLQDLYMPRRRSEIQSSIFSAVAAKPTASEDELAGEIGVNRSTVVSAFRREGGRTRVILKSGGKPWETRLEWGYFKKVTNRRIFFIWLTAGLGYFPIEETTEIFAPILGGEKTWRRISGGTLKKEYPPFDKIVGLYSKQYFHKEQRWTTTELIRYDWQMALNSSLYLVFCSAADILPSEWLKNERSWEGINQDDTDAAALINNRKKLRRQAIRISELSKRIEKLRLRYRPILLVTRNKSEWRGSRRYTDEERMKIVIEKNGTTSFMLDRAMVRGYLKILIDLGLIREIDGKIAYVPLRYKKFLAVHKKIRNGKTEAS